MLFLRLLLYNRFLIGFMEAACKRDPAILPKVVANIQLMLNEENPNIQKRAIQAATQLYKVCLKWVRSDPDPLVIINSFMSHYIYLFLFWLYKWCL